MTSRRIARLALAPALALAVAAVGPAQVPEPARPAESSPAPRAVDPKYIDDDDLLDTLTNKLSELAKAGKCLGTDGLKEKVGTDRTTKVVPAKPGDRRLDPEEVYELALQSVFIVGSVVKKKTDKGEDEYIDGRMATGWVLAADGVLVTNWHVFDQVEDGEVFGAMDHAGNVYPLTDVLAVNKKADVAIIKLAAQGLKPLAVAARPAAIGSWVGVLGHPGDRYFTFTQGAVSRYSKVKYDDGTVERWMSVTADYAYGSSGSPVLNRYGAVVGMAAMTESLDYPEGEIPPPVPPKEGEKNPKRAEDKKPEEKKEDEKKPESKGSPLQMVVKLTAPTAEIRKVIRAE